MVERKKGVCMNVWERLSKWELNWEVCVCVLLQMSWVEWHLPLQLGFCDSRGVYPLSV